MNPSEEAGEAVTISDLLGTMVGILVPFGRVLRVSMESLLGKTWYWKRLREGCPERTKAESEGAKMVAVGESRLRVLEMSWRVRDMER